MRGFFGGGGGIGEKVCLTMPRLGFVVHSFYFVLCYFSSFLKIEN